MRHDDQTPETTTTATTAPECRESRETRESCEETGYNGWTNYETWVTMLWIGNDPYSDHYARELVETAYNKAELDLLDDPDANTAPRADAADALKAWITDLNPLDGTANLFTDLMGHALGAVVWFEMVDHIRQDSDRYADDDD